MWKWFINRLLRTNIYHLNSREEHTNSVFSTNKHTLTHSHTHAHIRTNTYTPSTQVLRANIFESDLGCRSACQMEIQVNISSHKYLHSAEIHWRTPTQVGCSLWWLARTHQIFVLWALPTTTLLKYAVIDTLACWRRCKILYKGLSNKRAARFEFFLTVLKCQILACQYTSVMKRLATCWTCKLTLTTSPPYVRDHRPEMVKSPIHQST